MGGGACLFCSLRDNLSPTPFGGGDEEEEESKGFSFRQTGFGS